MSTVTLSPRKDYAQGYAAATPKAGFFARLYAAIVAAQTAKAERELAYYMARTGKHLKK